MSDLRIYIESTWNGPSKRDGVAEYLLEYKKGDIPITKQGYIHLKDGTETQGCLMALINAFHLLRKPCEVLVNTPSRTILNTIENEWLEKWQQNEWKTAKGEEVKNKDLWQMLLDKTKIHSFKMEYGHHEYRNVMKSEVKAELERWGNEQINNSVKNRTLGA